MTRRRRVITYTNHPPAPFLRMKTETTLIDPRAGNVSASGVERVALCPGSYMAEKGKPRQTNELAEAGTRIHAALEAGNVDALDDDEEIGLAVKAAELRDKLIGEFYREAPTLVGVEINHKREERLRGLGNSVSGQFDGLVLDDNRALIYDFKFGYLEPIDATHNLQMRCLAVLVAENYESVNEITAAIIQPRLRPEFSVVKYYAGDLTNARAELEKILNGAYTPGAPRRPGPKQCLYCKAKADCPEAAALTESLTEIDAAVIPLDQWPELLDRCVVAEKFIKAFRIKAKEIMGADPAAIPGFMLRAGAKVSEIASPQKLFNRCNERHSILPHEFVQICDVPKGKLKDLLKTASGLKGKALETEFESLLKGLVKQTRKAASIAKDK